MQKIRIQVVRSRRYRATDAFHVCWDHGTGVMDWAHPETGRRIMFWEDAPVAAGHLVGGFMMGPHLDGSRPDGHLEGTHLLDAQAFPAASIAYDSEPLIFGRFRYAVVTQDAAGNTLTDGVMVHEAVINSDPPPPGDFHVAAYRGDIHQLEFSLPASPGLVG
jgi:hypothetical protein